MPYNTWRMGGMTKNQGFASIKASYPLKGYSFNYEQMCVCIRNICSYKSYICGVLSLMFSFRYIFDVSRGCSTYYPFNSLPFSPVFVKKYFIVSFWHFSFSFQPWPLILILLMVLSHPRLFIFLLS